MARSICLHPRDHHRQLHQHLDQSVRPARSPDSVAVLLEAPQQPYTVIALIESNTETVFDSFDDLRREMVAEAAKLGGEALILGPEVTDSEFIYTGTAMIQSDKRKLTGEVIVYERDRNTQTSSIRSRG